MLASVERIELNNTQVVEGIKEKNTSSVPASMQTLNHC